VTRDGGVRGAFAEPRGLGQGPSSRWDSTCLHKRQRTGLRRLEAWEKHRLCIAVDRQPGTRDTLAQSGSDHWTVENKVAELCHSRSSGKVEIKYFAKDFIELGGDRHNFFEEARILGKCSK
jgi:hypothetical protein